MNEGENMRTHSKLSLFALLVMLSMLLAACPPAAPAAPAAEAPAAAAPAADAKPYIPVISKGFQHQFWQAVKVGAKKAARDLNVDITFEGPESETMVDKQIEMLQTALDKKPAAICLAALDSKAVIPLLEKAKAAGIPVVGFDSGVDSDIPVTTAATDNIAAAGLAADKMAELFWRRRRSGSDRARSDQPHRHRLPRWICQPHRRKISKYQGCGYSIRWWRSSEIDRFGKDDHSGQSKPEGFLCANEGSIIGVLNAVKELGKENQLVVIGYDAGKQQMDAVRSGVEAGAITQNPVGIGYKCVESAVKAIKGETFG